MSPQEISVFVAEMIGKLIALLIMCLLAFAFVYVFYLVSSP